MTNTTRQSLPSLSPKDTAAQIRKVLKAQFPATKFSVTTSRGSMCSSVRVEWRDGPTVGLVDSLVGCFEAGRFDGMKDSYEYDRNAFLMIDGQMMRPGCRYVMTQRETSAALARRCAQQIAAYFGLEVPAIIDGGRYWTVDASQVCASRDRAGFDWPTLIYQASTDASRFTFKTVEG